MKSKKGAMEMSVGTIVTIVLLMSVLVLGLFLVQNIFRSAKGAVDLTDQQLQAEIGKLFADESKLTVYPTSKKITIKIGETDAIGLGIKNIATTANAPTDFSYEVVSRGNDCNLNDNQAMSFISLGKSESGIPIPIGSFETARITFRIPEGVPNCLVEYRVLTKRGGQDYDSETFIVETKA